MSVLKPEEVARIYDRLGRWQDWQAFYEDPATDRLIAHACFEQARSVFELGCGTGRFAALLLSEYLPSDARYIGIDISPRMVQLATERLRRWSDRAEVRLTTEPVAIPAANASVDRFLANYVLDLLSVEHATEVLAEARRVLGPSGKLCLVSLSHGTKGAARLVSMMWWGVWSLWPRIVGGCRPIELASYLAHQEWSIEHRSVITAWGLSSEVVVASRTS